MAKRLSDFLPKDQSLQAKLYELYVLECIRKRSPKARVVEDTTSNINILSGGRDVFTSLTQNEELPSEYKSMSFDYLISDSIKPPEWLVESLIPVGTVSIVGGDGGVGKSWVVLHLALSVATGEPLFSKFQVKQGKVLIIDEENALPLISQRLKKLVSGTNIDKTKVPLQVIENQGIQLDSKESYQRLDNTLSVERPNLVIIDSLKRVNVADENSAREMDLILRKAKYLSNKYNFTIIFTHHTTKPAPFTIGGLRGSSDIRNFVDSAFLMKKGSQNLKKFTLNKTRWSIPIQDFTISIDDIDDDNATVIKYIGNIEPKKRTSDKAKEEIVRLLQEKGERLRKDIIDTIEDIGQNTIDNALNELEREGIIRSKGGIGTAKAYFLKDK